MKTFEELTEVEKALRSLIFAAESRNDIVPEHPFPLGEAFLNMKITQAKEAAERLGIPLADREEFAHIGRPKCIIDNGPWAWSMLVDGKDLIIDNPEYFSEHYKALGYEVIGTESFRDSE